MPRIESTPCPHCGVELDVAELMFGDDVSWRKPQAGDFMFCGYCASILGFDADVVPQELSTEVIHSIFDQNPHVMEMQTRVKEFIAHRAPREKQPFKMTKPLGSVPYDGPPPDTYCCEECGAVGVKLWRQYNTFLCYLRLLCVDCASKDQGKDPEDFPEAQLGELVAAVPTEDGDSFWGFAAVPPEGVKWWHNLPARKPRVDQN